MKRRSALWLLPALATPSARAQRRSSELALAVGAERLLVECGFAAALRRRFAIDTGLALRLEGGASSELLPALARGEIDVALTHAPALAAALEAEGRIHDGRAFAASDFLLVGPRADSPVVAHDALQALAGIARAGTPFVTRNDGSGTHLAEQALWRAAGIAPAAPWYRPMTAAGGPLLGQARAAAACCLVDRASWLAADRHAMAPRAEGDARLATTLRLHRSLVATHHAGKLFAAWLSGRAGHSLVARTPGLRPPHAAA